jgi:1,2-dihydroxy-3-keto-5-methylthiopentene dioxygenase
MKAFWIDSQMPIPINELQHHGVSFQHLPTNESDYLPQLKEIMALNGYYAMDQVILNESTPNFEDICKKFIDEHLHTDDEVRFVLNGSGVFEIRSLQDQWMKIIVEEGDFISVPANRFHRFYLTDENTICCMRLFKDKSGWVPLYRKNLESSTSR